MRSIPLQAGPLIIWPSNYLTTLSNYLSNRRAGGMDITLPASPPASPCLSPTTGFSPTREIVSAEMFVYSAAGCYKESPNCVAAVAVKLLPEDLKLGERQSCFTHLAKGSHSLRAPHNVLGRQSTAGAFGLNHQVQMLEALLRCRAMQKTDGCFRVCVLS